MTIHLKAAEQYFTVVLFVSQIYPVCNFGKFINFGLSTVMSERINAMPTFCTKISQGLSVSKEVVMMKNVALGKNSILCASVLS